KEKKMAPPPQQLDRVSGSDEQNQWGLKVPGRPPTPSEGAAQLYNRVGPRDEQKILAFDNGTCLTFGPMDRVDEWDLDVHPFVDQVAQIDKAIHEVKTVRDRYNGSEEGDNAFSNFRSTPAPANLVTEVTLSGVTYKQVPSKYATLTDMVSVFSKAKKDENHADTRYGTTGRPPLDAIPRFVPYGPNPSSGGPPAPRYYQRPDNSRSRRANRRAADREHLSEGAEDDGKTPAQRQFERRLADELEEYKAGRGPFIGLGAYLQSQGGGNHGTGQPHQQPNYMQSLSGPTYQGYAGYVMNGAEQSVDSALPSTQASLRPPPGFEPMNSRRQMRRVRSSMTLRDDDVLRVQQYIETANHVYAHEGYPRMTFQPPTPNMQPSGVVMQNRLPELIERPSSTDSGWLAPTIHRSPSSLEFRATPTGLLAPSSRFGQDAAQEPPLTADTQIWGPTYNQSAVPSREPSPGTTGSLRGRRLYESGSRTSTRVPSPSGSFFSQASRNERHGSGSSASGPSGGAPGSSSGRPSGNLGGNRPGSRTASGRGQRNW
ncbi:hypothetical protein HYFRA_00001546, partial [Hymenoscyphus fraxineus]